MEGIEGIITLILILALVVLVWYLFFSGGDTSPLYSWLTGLFSK